MQTLKLARRIVPRLALLGLAFVVFEFNNLVWVAKHELQRGLEIQRSFSLSLGHLMHQAKDGGHPEALAAAFGLCFLYGVLHALGPGHGKFVVMTYFLSHQRRWARGFLMGTQIAIMHVVSAIAIFLLAHYAAERLYNSSTGDMPALRSFSYGSILAIGLYMLWRATHGGEAGCDHCGHDHEGHNHEHGHEKQGLLSLAVGVAPCSGAVLLLLFAFANDLVWLGIALTAAIAAGMAITMIALGLASIFARQVMAARLARTGTASAWPKRIEIGGACLIILFGGAMTLASLYR
jgi:ABC-type nickel/cobalt efflux system permease component RcnA